MGASGWDCFVPYQEDISAALADAWERTFAEQAYYWPHDGQAARPERPRPVSLQQLLEGPLVQELGTHSIIDIQVIAEDHDEAFGAAVPLQVEDVVAVFGTDTPTRAQFDGTEYDLWSLIPERYCAHYVVLYQDGHPHELAFWGFSGD